MAALSSCPEYSPQVESIEEFIERFTVQCADLLDKAGEDGNKKARVLVKALPVNVITDLQRRIKPTKLSEATYDDLVAKLTSQYGVQKSEVAATVQFLNRKQSSSESIECYAKVLNDLAAACKYKDCCRDRMLRDAFISGLRCSAIMTAILQDCEKKTFNQCVEKAKIIEQVTADAQDLNPANTSFKIHNATLGANRNRPTYDKKLNPISAIYVCIRCGAKGSHLAKDCYARTLICSKCKKEGHLARKCLSSSSKTNKLEYDGNVATQEYTASVMGDVATQQHTVSMTREGRGDGDVMAAQSAANGATVTSQFVSDTITEGKVGKCNNSSSCHCEFDSFLV